MLNGYARFGKSEAQEGATQAFEETDSGGRWDRPAFTRMLGELQSADVVVVPALDHLASSLTDLVHLMEKVLRAWPRISASISVCSLL